MIKRAKVAHSAIERGSFKSCCVQHSLTLHKHGGIVRIEIPAEEGLTGKAKYKGEVGPEDQIELPHVINALDCSTHMCTSFKGTARPLVFVFVNRQCTFRSIGLVPPLPQKLPLS